MIHSRYHGKNQAWHDASAKQQLISPAGENTLVGWIGHEGTSGTLMDHQWLMHLASDIAGCDVGKNWVDKFHDHHMDLSMSKAQKLNPKCANNFNKFTYDNFADKYAILHEKYGGIPPEHIWNMDEKGIQIGGGCKKGGKTHFFLRGQVDWYKIGSDNLELVTIIECVSTAGFSIPPAFILKDGPLPSLQKLPDDAISSVAISPTGWTDNKLGLEWIKRDFIPYALKHCVSKSAPILLIYDGHESHKTSELKCWVYSVKDCEIITFCFSSKCTHKLQPLNIAVFTQVECNWISHCSKFLHEGFQKTGLYPVNHDVFTDTDFAPSQASSTQVHVPDSFPLNIPSSDPAIPSDAESEYGTDSGDQNFPHTINTIITLSDDKLEDDTNYISPTDDVIDGDYPGHQTHSSHSGSNDLDLQTILTTYTNIPTHIDEEKSHLELFLEI
ncbi:hypothetical protein P691DRAFT_788267 [Macrolepiota fuliginosa MF-IS2]|uniref:HTH CENPB-type domain-containing protein n=1 Tax=Macrolepiota fuliginosa MF-IS2 TaxID=1400762 RepID=A0A9P5XKJ1_9AGAR|nr:hypothetical protein P691DRAFT_788267 [Macrolepiota fuliginosa MF-IS2]